MITVTIHEAKTHLSRLIREVLSGEEVIIAKGKNPVAKLTPISAEHGSRKIGPSPGIITHIAEDFDEPLEDFKDYTT
jgi:prevent-host-death family protein